MKSKLLFSITLRDVNYLLENDYLNETLPHPKGWGILKIMET